MTNKVFERYDIRGKYPGEIDEKFAEKIGRSYGFLIKQENGSKVVVSRDTKESSERLTESLILGLEQSGLKVLDAGIGPTDYAALTGMKNKCFSVQVTSSHLPLDRNGFKFMYPEGNSLVNKDLDRIRRNFTEENFTTGEGSVEDIEDESREKYIEKAITFLEENSFDPSKSIYVDTLGGASGTILPELLEKLDLNNEINDELRDPPNPEKHDLEELKSAVDSGRFELGVSMDMDADRARIYYENEWLDGDTVFAALASQISPPIIVGSIDSSIAVRESFDGDFLETRVGDPFVLGQMVEEDAVFSGEPNCHYAFNDFVPYNSGIMTALVFSSIDINQAIDVLKDIISLKYSTDVKDKEKSMKNIIEYLKPKNRIESLKDGIKYRSGRASVLIRASGTSEKLRVIVHAEKKEDAEKALGEAKSLIN